MWIATYAQPCRQVSVVERLVNGRCAAGLTWHKPANAPAPTTKIPVTPALLVGLGNVHVVISLGILIISSIRNHRGSHSQGHRLPTHTPSSNLNSLIGIVHAPCFMFRNRNFPGGPGGKSGSPPDAEPWAPNPRPVEDRGLAIFVDNQKSVWLLAAGPRMAF